MSQKLGEDTNPKVSIGLPVFNGGKFVRLAIESILAQTFRDFELIICDNASTDETEVVCREFAEKDPRVTYIRQPENLGASANFADAFNRSTGVYFKWHGHDDLIAPTYLERLVEALDDDPDCILVYPRCIIINGRGEEIWCFLEFFACDSEKPDVRLAKWFSRKRDGLTNPCFSLMRREVLGCTALLAPYLAADRALLTHLALLGRSKEVPENLFFRRLHTEMSTSANENKRDLRAWFDGKRPLLVFKQWRLLYEYFALINRTPIGMSARIRCYGVLVKWMRSRGLLLLAELMLPLYFNGRITPLGRFTRRILRPIIHLSR